MFALAKKPLPFSAQPSRWTVMRSGLMVMILSTPLFGQALEARRTPRKESVTAKEIAQAQQFGQTLGIADWMGPLAPVALSPFFGIACLSGMSLYGQGWVSAENAFLGQASPLNNHAVFWVFAALTLVTSVPRLTKVSKPVAQSVDQIEAWAGIITMIVLRILMNGRTPDSIETATIPEFDLVQLGLGTVTLNGLLMMAAAINVFVINSVKFFFEVLIWITPVPMVDAVFEFANKALCATLMAIYGYSPSIATVINLLLFCVAAILFRWAYRREVFFRTLLVDAGRALLKAPSRCPDELIVFPADEFGPFPARTRCRLARTETGWTLTQQRLLSADVLLELPDDSGVELDAGVFTNAMKVSGELEGVLTFSRLYNGHLPELAEKLGARLNAKDAEDFAANGLRGEMA